MKIKICGLFRNEDIDYINEARPDYAGFVFAKSKRQVSLDQAQHLRSRLADRIIPVGVFVDAPVAEVAALYRNGIISIAQLHGKEDEDYIARLKEACNIPVIKVMITNNPQFSIPCSPLSDYYLFDSGAGTGKTFNWDSLETQKIDKPWFLAGGINLDNIRQAMTLNPYAIDVSSGAETDGFKDREKVLQLTNAVKNYHKEIK